jgi:L-cysteine:1D-myo-inositol 2-amino-2-deoxy-alpha-D-glucopyranoside ligase
MVGLDGTKMSKSRGNLVLVSKLRADGVDPAAIRLALLAHHTAATGSGPTWRSRRPRNACCAGATRWRTPRPTAGDLVSSVREALADDLQTPRALAAIDVWADGAHGATVSDPSIPRHSDPDAPATVRVLADALLGIAL